jgi:hypothetical protein
MMIPSLSERIRHHSLDPSFPLVIYKHATKHASQTTQEIKAMSETLKIIFMIFIVIGALFFALRITGWKMKKAADFIIRDLKLKEAFDPASAVDLPYTKSRLLNVGLRDYRPRALEELLKQDTVRMLEGGRYYLCGEHKLKGPDDRSGT